MRPLAVLCALLALTPIALPCTIFVVARNGRVLAGANEDYTKGAPNDKHWVRFVPAPSPGKLGYVGFGYNFSPILEQAATNEAGLFYDYNALPVLETPNPGAPRGNLIHLREMITTCRTVDEAVALLTKYDFTLFNSGQMVIGDAAGASAIIERHTVTRRSATLDFQIGTNFRTSTTPKQAITCGRYKACDSALGRGQPVSVESVRALLEMTMPPKESNSISWYTTVSDLKAGLIYLFRKGDFEQVSTIDIRAELAKGVRTVDMDEVIKTLAKPYRKASLRARPSPDTIGREGQG